MSVVSIKICRVCLSCCGTDTTDRTHISQMRHRVDAVYHDDYDDYCLYIKSTMSACVSAWPRVAAGTSHRRTVMTRCYYDCSSRLKVAAYIIQNQLSIISMN